MDSGSQKGKRIVNARRETRIHSAARIVARFFKSLKLRTFAYRSRIEKRRRAVITMQSMFRIWKARKTVRYRRREVIRRRRETAGALLLQRNFRKKFASKVAQNLELVNMAVALTRDKLLEEMVDEAVDTRARESRESLVIDDAVMGVEAALSNEVIDACVDEEEQRQIQVRIDKMAQEAARIERERVAMEMEIVRREKEEAERLRLEEEEKARIERLKREREEERIAIENKKKAEEERAKAELEASRLAAEAEEVARKAAEEATSLADFAAMTATMEGTKAQFLATQPVVDDEEVAELMDFKKTIDAQAATRSDNAQVWTISTPNNPTATSENATKGPRNIGKSMEGDFVNELSAFTLALLWITLAQRHPLQRLPKGLYLRYWKTQKRRHQSWRISILSIAHRNIVVLEL